VAKSDPTVHELKTALEQWQTMLNTRSKMVDVVKSHAASDPIGTFPIDVLVTVATVLLDAFSKKETNFESVFVEHLKRYDASLRLIDEHTTQQTQLMTHLQAANEKFKHSKQNNEGKLHYIWDLL
jgi:hypothetical protein